MRWLSANWVWLVVIGGMLWMHLGMHRGHGGSHGGHGGHGGGCGGHGGHDGEHEGPELSRKSHNHEGSTAVESVDSTEGGGHRHGGC